MFQRTSSKAKDWRRKKRSVSEISIMQLQARRESRRTKSKYSVVSSTGTTCTTGSSKKTFSPVPVRLGLIEENRQEKILVITLLITLFIQTIAIMWNMFALWNESEPEVWHDDVQTKTAKSLITITCVIMTVLVILIRLIDLKQLPEGTSLRRYYSFIISESIFLMLHIPPFTFGSFTPEYDVWNILGTSKYYLILEVCKINHPLWLRRYEAAAARAQAKRPPKLIGSFFCWTAMLSQLDPMSFFACMLFLALGMFTMWIYFMERSSKNFQLADIVDYILSAFFSVPPYNFSALKTMTGRCIKIITGLFSMCYAAVVGWTFGFRVAENAQTVTDLLDDVNEYIKVRHESAKIIQTWWKEILKQNNSNVISTFLKGTKALPSSWSKAIASLRNEKMRTMVTRLDLMTEMDKIRMHIVDLKSSNERLTKSNEDLRNLLATFLKEEREL